MTRKKGTPKLDFRQTLDLIKQGQIQNRQIGRAPLWIVTASYPRMGIRIGSILVPNVSRNIFCVLNTLDDLLQQQKDILEDSYALGEAPELDDVFETLVHLSHLGPQNHLDLATSQRVARELSKLAIKIERHSSVRKKIHENISRIIQSVIRGLTTRTIRGKVGTAIETVLDRMSQIDTIIPLVEFRRSAALREIIRHEKMLWKIAYELKTRSRTTRARNIKAALKRDCVSIKVPDVQSYRLKVQNAKRTVGLALIALGNNKPDLAQQYLEHAVRILGYSPEDLSPLVIRA